MKASRSLGPLVLVTALVFSALLFTARPSFAQWQQLHAFGSQIRSLYFLDGQGTASTGFAGLSNSEIWRTTDNGVTWSQMTTPSESAANPVEITDITFRNTSQGWCCTRTFSNTNGEVWETTNGGANWTSIYSSNGGFVSIRYAASSGELVSTCWNANGVSSNDYGVTWASSSSPQQNGVTFSGTLGVTGVYGAPATSALYSADGGVTWNATTSLTAETWSPYGLAGTTTFVAAAEKTRQVFVSSDGGLIWNTPYTFPSNETPNGCIMGTVADLFVETSGAGFFCSTDLGNTWFSICGPSSPLDTRFYSIGTKIFAGDYAGNLWYTADGPNAGQTTVALDRPTFHFSGIRCATFDSVLHITVGNGCSNVTLTKAQIVAGGLAFSININALPQTITSADSVSVTYYPGPTLSDSGKLLLEFTVGPKTIDTIVPLYGTAKNSSRYSRDPDLLLSVPYACMTKDSMVVIRNFSCDTLTLLSDSIADTAHFAVGALTLPHAIKPFDSLEVPILVYSSHDGYYTSSLALHFLAGDSGNFNDAVPLALNVFQGAEAEFGALQLSLLNRCVSLDTSFMVFDTKCDSITLLQAYLSDSSSFRLGNLTLPAVIEASGSMVLPVHVTPGAKGSYTTLLNLVYQSGSRTVDTAITLSLKVLYDLPLKVQMASRNVNMGIVGVPCGEASRWIALTNTLCHELTIENIQWVNADTQYSFDHQSFPLVLPADGGMDSLLLHYIPDSAYFSSDQLRITLDMDGRELDTVLTVSGLGISTYHDTVLTPTLAFDTVLACQSAELTGEIVNLSCDSIVATSASLLGTEGFSIESPSFPVTLHNGDTLRLLFKLQPLTPGAAQDSAVIVLHDHTNDSDYTRTIALSAFVRPPDHAIALSGSSFTADAMAPCASLDSFVTITNSGNCDNVVIADTALAGAPGISFLAPLTLPIVLAPDSSVRIPFRIATGLDTEQRTTLTLSGQHIDTTILFSYRARSSAYTMSVSATDTVFQTRPCLPASKTYRIANTGCDSLTVDSLALLAGSQFSVSGVPAVPFTVPPGDTAPVTITFDPTANGGPSGELTIRSKQANALRSIALAGTTVGTVPTARVALQAADGTMSCTAKAGDKAAVTAVLLDAIGDTTALRTVTLTLRANRDLLTLAAVSPAPGWTLADTAFQPDGSLFIRLQYLGANGIPAGSDLVSCYFRSTLSDSAGCDIALSNVRFNDSLPNYETCVLASIPMSDPVRFTTADTCGSPDLRELLEGRLALRIVSIVPNPAAVHAGTAQCTLTFELAARGAVSVRLRDILGRECARADETFPSGPSAMELSFSHAAEGTYFLEVSANGAQEVRKMILESGQ